MAECEPSHGFAREVGVGDLEGHADRQGQVGEVGEVGQRCFVEFDAFGVPS